MTHLESIIEILHRKARSEVHGSPQWYRTQETIAGSVRAWRALGNTLRSV